MFVHAARRMMFVHAPRRVVTPKLDGSSRENEAKLYERRFAGAKVDKVRRAHHTTSPSRRASSHQPLLATRSSTTPSSIRSSRLSPVRAS